MFNLSDYRDELTSLTRMVSSTFELDTAVFGTDASLIASTDSYLSHKGMTVHSPSIQEVIYKGNVIINRPGHMESCTGCRFKDNCPSTVEILKSITLGSEPVGVVTITSFSKEGHDKIMSDVSKYTRIIEDLTGIISSLLSQRYRLSEFSAPRAALTTVIELSDDAYILTDPEGNIDDINTFALKMFSSCGMNTKTIYQLFPDNIVSIILSGRTISGYGVKINGTAAQIFSAPIKDGGLTTGVTIRVTSRRLSADTGVSGHRAALYTSDEIKGRSSHVESIKKKITKISDSPSTVFICGETGTGKTMLAKAIHNDSRRRNKPFVTVNCTSIPESLFESELFGYESGAFTGAKKEGKPGKFELANEGTLFLDEISEIPVNIQAKLLSVLQDSIIERVGGITPIAVNVRIIAASNRNILEMIAANRFRSDLFYRLNVIPVELIPLRERREDISILASDFLKRQNEKLNRQVLGFDNDVLELFNRYSWPGNIRQLENVVEYCVNMADKNVITQDDLPADFLKSFYLEINQEGQALKDSEYELIVNTINKYGWDVKGKTMAARELGFGLRTLYRRLNGGK